MNTPDLALSDTHKAILTRIFPFLGWLPFVQKKTVKSDLLAGLTGAIIVLPQGVAFSMIAGLPPIYGLYTAMITPIIAALFGSSRHLISGPTTPLSLMVFASISPFAEPSTAHFIELTMVMTMVAGIIQLALGIGKFGMLINFVSHSVVIGFTTGAAFLIVASQLKYLFGLSIPRGKPFLDTILYVFQHYESAGFYVMAVAILSFLSAVISKVFFPRAPYLLVGLFTGSVVAWLLGGEARGITFVGEMPSALPPFSFPYLSLENIQLIAPSALAVALLGLIEAVAIARSISVNSKQKLDGNQEFIGQGLSNIIGSWFSCYAGTGSFTRSGVNYQAGAKTPLSAIFAAVILFLMVMFLAPLTAYLPMASMGAIIMLVAWNLIQPNRIREIFHASKKDLAVLLLTFISTLFLSMEFAIYGGVILSLLFYLQKTARPYIAVMAPDQDHPRKQFINIIRKKGIKECPQIKVVRIDGELYFGALEHISNTLDNFTSKGEIHLIILAEGINFIDLDGAEWLSEEAKKWKSKGGGLYLVNLKMSAQEVLQDGEFITDIGQENLFSSKTEALTNVYPKLDKEICSNCQNRIFFECQKEFGLPVFSNDQNL